MAGGSKRSPASEEGDVVRGDVRADALRSHLVQELSQLRRLPVLSSVVELPDVGGQLAVGTLPVLGFALGYERRLRRAALASAAAWRRGGAWRSGLGGGAWGRGGA